MRKILRHVMLGLFFALMTCCAVFTVACGTTAKDACADGHAYGEPSWNWEKADGTYTVTATFTCANNAEHTAVETATVTKEHKESTCSTDGDDVYTAKVTFGGVEYTDTKTDILSASGHVWKTDWAWVKNTDGTYKAVATLTCERDKNHVLTETAEVNAQHTDATCTVKGKDVFTASATVNGVVYSDTKTVEYDYSDHDYEVISEKAATCDTLGKTEFKCKNCPKTYEETKPVLGHDWDYAEATCEHGQTCQRADCGETRPALNHNYSPAVTTALSCEDDEITTYTCSVCSHSYEIVTAYATGHVASGEWSFVSETPVTGETCKVDVTYSAVCGECGNPVEKVETVERHTLSATIKTAATCSHDGVKLYSCANCSHTEEAAYSDAEAHSWVAGGSRVAENITVYTCEHCHSNKSVVSYANETQATVSKDTLASAGEIELKEANIALDSDALSGLEGDVSISANVLTQDQIDQLGVEGNITGKVYDFTVENSNVHNGQFNGKVTVSIPYELEAGEDPDCIAILYISEDGTVATYEAKYSNGFAVFETTHFSYYTVTRLSPLERCKLYGHTHKETEYKVTCVTEGYIMKVCVRCGDTQRIVTSPALGHNMQVTESVAATCTASGHTDYECANGCGLTKHDFTPTLGHNWTLSDSGAATCQHAGYEVYVCSNDSAHTYRNTIAQKQHSFIETVTDPTCTQRGYTTYTCADCGYSYEGNYRIALGHNYITTVVEPECFKTGYTLHKCDACGDEYRTDEVAPRHSWNMEAPTCGEAKVCVICGTVGAEATGEHSMVNGVCSVCGHGCDHANATVTVVKPTCTENGYTLTVCASCGLEIKSDYVSATGHKGSAVCSVCGEKLLGENFFSTALAGMLDLNYALTISDFTVNVNEGGNDGGSNNVTVKFAELNIGIDADGKLFGCGALRAENYYNNVPKPLVVDGKGVIKDGKLYIEAEERGSLTSFGSGIFMIADDSRKMYAVMEVGDVFESMNMGEGFGEMILGSVGWIKDDLVPFVNSLINSNSKKINELGFKLADLFFNVTKTSTGYNLSLDLSMLSKLNDALFKMPVGEAVDSVLGAGSFDKFADALEDILTCTLGEILDNVDIDAAVGVLDKLAQRISGDDNATFAQLAGMDGDLKDMLSSDEVRGVTLYELLIQLTQKQNKPDPDTPSENRPVDKEEDYVVESYAVTNNGEGIPTADDIVGMVRNFKTVMLYDMLEENTQVNKLALRIKIDGVISEILKIKLDISTNADGKVSSVALRGNSEYLSGAITLNGTFAPSFNYDGIVENIKSATDGLQLTRAKVEAFMPADTQYEEYESGALRSMSYSETKSDKRNSVIYEVLNLLKRYDRMDDMQRLEMFAKESGAMDPYNLSAQITRVTVNSYYYGFKENCPVMMQLDCMGWAKANFMCDCRNSSSAEYNILVSYNKQTIEFAFSASDKETGYNSNSGNFVVYYNTVNKTFTKAEQNSSSTKHLYEEDTSKLVMPKDCTELGMRFFSCKHCGDSYVVYFTVPHSSEPRRECTLLDGDDCTHGVEVKEYCKVCDKLLAHYTTSRHVFTSQEVISFSEHGGCDNCAVLVNTCLCGKTQQLEYRNMHFEKAYDAKEEAYVCDNGCGAKVIVSHNRTADGCHVVVTESAKVYFGEKLIKEYSFTEEYTAHEIMEFVCLEEGAKTCADGWYVVSKCIRCGEEEYRSPAQYGEHSHEGVYRVVNFADYGAADGYMIIIGCACGDRIFDFNIRGSYTIRDNFDDNGSDLYILREDGFTVRVRRVEEKNTECYVTVKSVIDFGYNVQTDTYAERLELTQAERGYYAHDEYVVRAVLAEGANSCSDGVYVTHKCRDCGAESEPELVYDHVDYVKKSLDLKEYGAKCGEVLDILTCACDHHIGYMLRSTENLQFDFDDNHIMSNDEYDLFRISCAVTSPKCDLEFYYIRYTEGEEGEDITWIKEIVTDVVIDEENYTFTLTRTGELFERYTNHQYVYFDELRGCERVRGERCINCGDERIYDRHEEHSYKMLGLEYFDEKNCYGVAHVKCEVCGKETDMEGEFHEYGEPVTEKMGCEVTVTRHCERCGYNTREYYTEHNMQKEHTEATCTRYGYEKYYCADCGYIEYENHLTPHEHYYEFNDVKGMYVCTVCGMENINGADGDIVLEDLTDSENPELLIAGYYARFLGYETRNDWEDMYHVSVSLINNDLPEDDENREIAIDVEVQKGDQQVSINKADAVASAENLGLANYSIRLSFVHRTNGDLVYGITFE